ncbi:MAG: DUF1028 domain-containing protein [Saprospiraceae bacterium]|nr:DUF1028 domain-containing protein [Saprospiraceae bacterium]
MKVRTTIFLLFFLSIGMAQHTFSIVAIDEKTGEIGSAGATCLDDNSFPGSGGAIIISDVVPGVGAVHTQSYWNEFNQQNANLRLKDGLKASEIIEWLVDNDIQGRPGLRQYGVVTTVGDLDAAAFTGDDCLDQKKHVAGMTYAIQGNILISEAVIDSMEQAYLDNSDKPLCERLMAALQAANIPGADSRCLNEGVSSRSAFIRVAKSTDSSDNLWMDLNVPVTPFGVEPIDELQMLFDEFKSSLSTGDQLTSSGIQMISSNPADGRIHLIKEKPVSEELRVDLTDLTGKSVLSKTWYNKEEQIELDLSGQQTFIILVTGVNDRKVYFRKKILNQ